MRNSHPLLRFLPLRGSFLLPYGLYYSLTPSPNVQRFLDAFRGNGISGEVEDAPIVSFGNDKKSNKWESGTVLFELVISHPLLAIMHYAG